MIERISEYATNVTAAAAVASPWWLPSLADVSEVAHLFLPILGCGWLIYQMVNRWRNPKP